MSRASRRALLLAAPAVLLAACGDEPAPDAVPEPIARGNQQQGDLEVLGFLLEVERATLQALGDDGLARVRAHDRAHVQRLEQEITRLGGTPSDRTGPVATSPEDAKLTSLAAYLDALPKLYDERLRVLAAGMHAAEAAHLTQITGEAPDAFVLGERRA